MSSRGVADVGAADGSSLSAVAVPDAQRAPGGKWDVELADAADLTAIDRVSRASLQGSWSPAALGEEFACPDSHFWVVRGSEEVVGFIATRVVVTSFMSSCNECRRCEASPASRCRYKPAARGAPRGSSSRAAGGPARAAGIK